MDTSVIYNAVRMLVPLILSLTLHEYAHALVATRLGDDTALERGRMTLDPIRHIDPVGTLLLPLSLLFMFGADVPTLGWARPVPYNPTRFTRKIRMRTGAMLVAAAGPLANIAFALAIVVGVGLAFRLGLQPLSAPAETIFKSIIGINVGLAIFNLVPLPPLDGAKVLAGLLPAKQAQFYENLSGRAGIFLVMLLVVFGGRYLAYPMNAVLGFFIKSILPTVAGASYTMAGANLLTLAGA